MRNRLFLSLVDGHCVRNNNRNLSLLELKWCDWYPQNQYFLPTFLLLNIFASNTWFQVETVPIECHCTNQQLDQCFLLTYISSDPTFIVILWFGNSEHFKPFKNSVECTSSFNKQNILSKLYKSINI